MLPTSVHQGDHGSMIAELRDRLLAGRLWMWGMAAAVLLGAALFGSRASVLWLALPVAGIGAFVLLQQPLLGLVAVMAAGTSRFRGVVKQHSEVPF